MSSKTQGLGALSGLAGPEDGRHELDARSTGWKGCKAWLAQASRKKQGLGALSGLAGTIGKQEAMAGRTLGLGWHRLQARGKCWKGYQAWPKNASSKKPRPKGLSGLADTGVEREAKAVTCQVWQARASGETRKGRQTCPAWFCRRSETLTGLSLARPRTTRKAVRPGWHRRRLAQG